MRSSAEHIHFFAFASLVVLVVWYMIDAIQSALITKNRTRFDSRLYCLYTDRFAYDVHDCRCVSLQLVTFVVAARKAT